MVGKKCWIPATNLLFIVMMMMLTVYSKACDPEDEASLVAFSASLKATPPLNWSSSTSCCLWEGVGCHPIIRKVVTLKLVSRGLKGVISSHIGSLVSLAHLNLSKNDLHGSLGDGILGLIKLRTIDLSTNTISGHIPLNIGTLSSLERLHVQYNNLSGPIPVSLMTCVNLIDIFLANNHLEGDISELDFSKLVHLQKLDLLNNTFTGTLPETIYSCKSLTAIRVAANNLTGEISPKILELKSLIYLSLTQNSFTNITSALSILANCSNLTTLFLGSNFYGETLPSHSNFVGSTGFPKLQLFSLDACNLTASFPEWLSNIKTLRALTLHSNKIRGEIPSWIGDLPNLYSLDASSNRLYGEIPQELCRLPALISTRRDPKFNRFNLELPFFSLSHRGLEQYSTFPSSLLFSSNEISGHIPSEIGGLLGIQRIDFSNNHLSGNIPVAVSKLTNLDMLKLSNNNLTGNIRASFTKLNFLSKLNLSYNNLEGPIPSGGQFNTFEQRSFKGNPRLCGECIHISCTTNTTNPGNEQPLQSGNHIRETFLRGLYVGFASGFSGILVIVASYVCFTIRMGCSHRSLGLIYSAMECWFVFVVVVCCVDSRTCTLNLWR